MIFHRAASPSSLLQLPITPSPEASPCPSIFSAPSVYAGDDDTMSVSTELPSRPVSIAPPRAPTLRDILQNRGAPPYTLAAFTAYLSQKQCLENLEFTMDARQYARRYDELSAEMAGVPMSEDIEDCKDLSESWLRLLNAYIIPGAPKEVNLPDHIRRELLRLHPDRQSPFTTPPAPEILERAVEHIVELMDESIMMAFITDNAPKIVSHQHSMSNEFGITGLESDDERRIRGGSRLPVPDYSRQSSQSRRKNSPELQSAEPPHLQTDFSHVANTSSGPGLGPSASRGSVGSQAGSGDLVMIDENSTPSSPSDLITPPTTPPGADIGSSSPRQASNQNPWRKMIGRLGTKKRSASRMDR